jgi:hypothetical protein
VTGRVEPARVGLPCRLLELGVGLLLRDCRAVSLLDVELEGLEKVKDMEGIFGDDLIGSASRVLIRSAHVSVGWALDVGLLILPDRVTDGGIG